MPVFTRIAAVVALALTGCAERSPQYQVIPAVMDGDIVKVEALLNDKAHVNINWRAGGHGTSALITAAGHNQPEIARPLLHRGADPNLTAHEGFSALLAAAAGGHTDIVSVLIDAGANPNTQETRHGSTPLVTASSKGHIEIVKLLLDAGAERHTKTKGGLDAADHAWRHGHQEIFRMLTTYEPASAKASTE